MLFGLVDSKVDSMSVGALSLPSKTRVLRQITRESSPEHSAKSLSQPGEGDFVFLSYFFVFLGFMGFLGSVAAPQACKYGGVPESASSKAQAPECKHFRCSKPTFNRKQGHACFLSAERNSGRREQFAPDPPPAYLTLCQAVCLNHSNCA